MKSIDERIAELAEKCRYNWWMGGKSVSASAKIVLTELAADLQAKKEKEVAAAKSSRRVIIDMLRCDIESKKKKIAELQAWKESALKVMPDFQKLGKLLDLPLGSDVSEQLVPVVEKQTALLDEVKTIVERLATMPHIDQDDEFRLREGCKRLLTRLGGA